MKGIILSTVLLVFALVDSEKACPRSWTQLGKSCYVILDDPVTWIEAMEYCTAVGGYLVEINSAHENDFLTNLVNNSGADGAWIGLNDLAVEGQFVWTTTQSAPSYTNFATDQLKDYFGQDCVMITKAFKWNDESCHDLRRIACEGPAREYK